MIQPVNSASSQYQVDQTAKQHTQSPKPPQSQAVPEDRVSISESAKQAQADNSKKAASAGDRDHDGDSR